MTVNWIGIGSDNGLSPIRRQAIIWTNAGMLLMGPLDTHFSEILIQMNRSSFKERHRKMLSWKWRPLCLGLNVLSTLPLDILHPQHILNILVAKITTPTVNFQPKNINQWQSFTACFFSSHPPSKYPASSVRVGCWSIMARDAVENSKTKINLISYQE